MAKPSWAAPLRIAVADLHADAAEAAGFVADRGDGAARHVQGGRRRHKRHTHRSGLGAGVADVFNGAIADRNGRARTGSVNAVGEASRARRPCESEVGQCQRDAGRVRDLGSAVSPLGAVIVAPDANNRRRVPDVPAVYAGIVSPPTHEPVTVMG